MRRTSSLWTVGPLVAMLAGGCGGEASPAAERDRPPVEVLADSLIGSWLAAAGGMETWDGLESARYTITTVWFDSVGEIRRMRPRRVEMRRAGGVEQARVERPEAEGLYVQTWTGEGSWATLNDRPLPSDSKEVVETEYVGRDVIYWFGLPFKLYDPGVNRRARRTDEGGYEVLVTFGDQVGVHPGDQYFYYFLDDDPFPEEVDYIEQDKTEVDRNRTVWTGFGRAGNLAYVVARTWVNSEGTPTKELRIDDVQLNPTLPDSLFAAR